jgi:hypothetical protein
MNIEDGTYTAVLKLSEDKTFGELIHFLEIKNGFVFESRHLFTLSGQTVNFDPPREWTPSLLNSFVLEKIGDTA